MQKILKLAIKEKIVTSVEIFKKIGMDGTSFSLKLSGKREFSEEELALIGKVLHEIAKLKKHICAKIETLTMCRKDALEKLCSLAVAKGFGYYVVDDFSPDKFIVNFTLHGGYVSKPPYSVYIYEDALELIYNAENRKIGTYQLDKIADIFLKIRKLND